MSGQVRCARSPLDSPEVTAAKWLLDDAKDSGFAFERTGPGADAPLLGVRETVDWVDEIVLAGFWGPESSALSDAGAARWSCPVGCRWRSG